MKKPIVVLYALAFGLAFGLYCRACGIHVAFLEAESGIFLNAAFAPPAEQKNFLSLFIFHPYNGHYAPLFFIGEFLQAKLYRTSESAWFWRQMLICGLLGAAIACCVTRIGRTAGLSVMASRIAGISGAVFFLCQPLIIELVMWPFMAAQILTLSLVALAGYFLALFIHTWRTNHFACFLMTAYATMHVFGVGASISVAAIIVAGVLLILRRQAKAIDDRQFRQSLLWIALFIALTAVHIAIMLSGDTASASAGPPLTILQNLARLGWLFLDSLYLGLRHLRPNGDFRWPDKTLADIKAWGGASLMIAGLAALAGFACRYRKTGNEKEAVWLGLFGFPFLTFTIHIALIIFRLRDIPGTDAVMPYLIGGRYLIFPAFYIFMIGITCLLLFQPLRRLAVPLPFLAACGAVVGTAFFVHTALPVIWPYRLADSESVWRQAVSEAREDIETGRLVRNIDLSKIDQGFKSDLAARRNLLEMELGCSDCVRFEKP